MTARLGEGDIMDNITRATRLDEAETAAERIARTAAAALRAELDARKQWGLEGAVMTERRLQWILAGTAAVLALYWFYLAWAPSAAMETDWRARPVAQADAVPAVEPQPTPGVEAARAGAVSTGIVAPPVHRAKSRADARQHHPVVTCAASVRKRADHRRLCRRR